MSDLSELFDRDPLSLTTQDLDTIILELSRRKAAYNISATPSKSPQRATAKSSPLPDAAAAQLAADLKADGLDL